MKRDKTLRNLDAVLEAIKRANKYHKSVLKQLNDLKLENAELRRQLLTPPPTQLPSK